MNRGEFGKGFWIGLGVVAAVAVVGVAGRLVRKV